jgi:hypothetical protein
MSSEASSQGIEKGKVIGVAGYKQVLEDGPEEDSPESEQEEHGDELTGMYTSGMLDEKGTPVLARASMTVEQAEALHRQGRWEAKLQLRGHK